MTPSELTVLGDIANQLADIMSFGVGALVGIAFTISANKSWI
ncbi:MAG: hypothetical protein OCC45_13320 [Desulfotalea sp.]